MRYLYIVSFSDPFSSVSEIIQLSTYVKTEIPFYFCRQMFIFYQYILGSLQTKLFKWLIDISNKFCWKLFTMFLCLRFVLNHLRFSTIRKIENTCWAIINTKREEIYKKWHIHNVRNFYNENILNITSKLVGTLDIICNYCSKNRLLYKRILINYLIFIWEYSFFIPTNLTLDD